MAELTDNECAVLLRLLVRYVNHYGEDPSRLKVADLASDLVASMSRGEVPSGLPRWVHGE